MKVYLAGRYQEQKTMRLVRSVWAPEIAVTSRWIDGKHDGVEARTCALDDLADIDEAEALVLWNPQRFHGQGRGGRHVELGYALALGKRVLIVGDRENVFHSHPLVELYPDWPDAFAALMTPAPDRQGER